MTGKGGGEGVEGLNKKEKGLMDTDNSVVIMGVCTIGLNANGKKGRRGRGAGVL